MIPVFDGHNDALTRPDHADFATGRAGGHLDLPGMRAGGVRGGIFSIFTPGPDENPDDPQPVDRLTAAAYATAAAGRLLALTAGGALSLATRAADLTLPPNGEAPPLAVLHLEGAEALDPDLDALELWYAAGLRSLGPVWSRPNAFGSGVPFLHPASPDTGPGLTPAGVRLAERCGELGILVDVSHLNEQGFWDLARLEAGPLVASHSAVHAICPASRNLTDDQLDAIAASDGLVGIVFACPFLRPDGRDEADTPLELIAEHARYVAERIGVRHLALGSDFDGATIPHGLGGAAGMPRLLEAIARAGFSEEELREVAWGNWQRVLTHWWGGH